MGTSGKSSNSRSSETSAGNIEEIVEQPMEHDAGQNLNDENQKVQEQLNVGNGVEVDMSRMEDMVYEGMVFESEEKAFEKYSETARRVGFSVRRDKLVKRANGTMRKRVFVCFKQGLRKKDNRYQYIRKERPQIRTGCMARMVIKYEKENKWVVTDIIYEHNHPLPSTSKSYRLRPHRRIAEDPVAESGGLNAVEVSLENGFNHISRRQSEKRDNAGIRQVDCGAHFGNKRKGLGKEDARVLLEYFTRKKRENPAFFYSMIVDKENQVTNLFWADARSIMDYSYFGDVVIFDTSYRTNMYGWPFAPFIGVNHHKQTILFGGALILDESTESFMWLFDTWIKTMSGHKPKTILTDQCTTITKAISTVMPETRHGFCLWHVFQNVAKHLSHVYWIAGFLQDISKCIYNCETEEEFIAGWEKMLHDYNLVDNKWLDDLFKVREKWASVYRRDTFCADTATSQHNKSINNFLKKFVKRKFSFTDFLARYENALGSWRERELHEDLQSIQTSPNLPLPAPMLKQAADKYTRSVFEMFVDEYKEWILCKLEDRGADVMVCKYEVTQEKHAKGFISIDPSNCQVICSCKKFENVGILCRHIIKVLYHRNVHEIPAHYIRKRWSKDAKSGVVRDRDGNPIQADSDTLMLLRYNELFQKAINIATKGAVSEEVHLVAKRALDNAMLEIEAAIKATQRDPEGGLQTTLVAQSHPAPVNVGEEGTVGLDLEQRRKKSRIDLADCNVPSMNDLQQEKGKEGQNHRESDGGKSSNEAHVHPSLQLLTMPNSTPLPRPPVSMPEPVQFFYPIIRPNVPYIPSHYAQVSSSASHQGSSVPGIESGSFNTHSVSEVPVTQSEQRFPASLHPQPSRMSTRSEFWWSNQVLNPNVGLHLSTRMDLQTPARDIHIESSEILTTLSYHIRKLKLIQKRGVPEYEKVVIGEPTGNCFDILMMYMEMEQGIMWISNSWIKVEDSEKNFNSIIFIEPADQIPDLPRGLEQRVTVEDFHLHNHMEMEQVFCKYV